MSTIGRGQSPKVGTPLRVAAVQQDGERFRIVVLEGANVVEARTVEGAPASVLATLAREHALTGLIRIIPARHTVVRLAMVPDASEAETISALSLLAEAQLPALPMHRRATGVIPDALRAERTGLLTGWTSPEAPARLCDGLRETYIAELAALALLRGASSLAVRADRAAGVVVVLASGPARTLARQMVVDSRHDAGWRASIAGAVAETCAGVDLRAPEINPGRLHLDDERRAEIASQVRGARSDPEWLDHYGIALGAAMAVAVAPASSGLATMTASEELADEPVHRRAVRWLAEPSHSRLAIGTGLAMIFFLPLAGAGLRYSILGAKTEAISTGGVARDELERRGALYEELDKARWPMSKLLADISRAAPVGIVVDTIRLATDQGLTVQGVAETQDLVTTFQAALNNTRIFRNVKLNRVETKEQGRVVFDITAEVASPRLPVPKAEDFTAQPLAVRLYGEGASNTAAPVSTAEETRPRGARRQPRPAAEDTTDAPAANGDSSRRPSGTGTSSAELPKAVTDEDIAKLTSGEATKAWVARTVYIGKNGSMDPSEKQRLQDEIVKLKARQDAARLEEANAKPKAAPAGGTGGGS